LALFTVLALLLLCCRALGMELEGANVEGSRVARDGLEY